MMRRSNLISILILALCASMIAAQGGEPSGPAISGVCVDPDGLPQGFSRVTLFDASDREVASVVAAGNGTFAFKGIRPGRYYIRFSRLGAAAAWYGGEVRTSVVAGESDAEVRFAFPRGHTMSGSYTDPDGSPLGHCEVGLFDANMRQVSSVTTAVNGSFSFCGVRPGSYYLRFSRFGAPDAWFGGRNPVSVKVGEAPVSLDFSHPGGLGIRGTCLDPDGQPLPFTRVSLFDEAEKELLSLVAAGNGSFAFTGLNPGAYYIKFSREGTPDAWYGDASRRAVIVGDSPVVEVCLRGR